ncbi:hypothetical protein GQ42DRAFT_70125 [Ramicandelaber brevisporus]|nr:hypothetical protein GQ42DRAFT_70125 [Ramicandelaber brevisporus]
MNQSFGRVCRESVSQRCVVETRTLCSSGSKGFYEGAALVLVMLVLRGVPATIAAIGLAVSMASEYTQHDNPIWGTIASLVSSEPPRTKVIISKTKDT